MVDRGGLNYPIRVRDEFSKTTQLFRQELRASKASFRDFQKSLASSKSARSALRDTADAARALGQAQRTVAQSTTRTKKPLTEQEQILKRLAEVQRQQTAREREAVRIRNRQAADAAREAARRRKAAQDEERALKALARAEAARAREAQKAEAARAREQRVADKANATVQAEKRINAELFQRQIILKQIELLRTRSAALAAGGDLTGAREAAKRAKELEQSLAGAAKQGNSLFFTFRRLVGTLAIFTLARRAVQAFNELVAGGLRFNDTIEASTIGIAGLVATLGDVRNEFGQSVSAAEELNLSLGIARDQIGKLRQDSLRTVATFQELLDTFQIAVGPGLAAGLNLDEVRQLTVDISQAASALGVPQNQLAEEVRSLLSGTIQARTTRIATALGITNEDIRTLKETGELFDFLEERFSGFSAAAQKQARETLDGISTLVRGIVEETLGQAAQPLFEELLALGNELFDEVLTIQDELGNIRPNPEVVSAFRRIFDALRDGVRQAREFGEALGFDGLQSVLGGVGVAFQVIIGAVGVVVRLVAELLSGITAVREQLGLTSTQADDTGRSIGAWGARILIATQLMKVLNTELLKSVRGPAILVAAFAAVAKAIEFILEKIFDVDLNIRETVELVTLGLFGAWIKIVEVVQTLAESTTSALGGALDFVVSNAKRSALQTLAFIQSELLFDDVGAQAFKDRAFEEELAFRKRDAAREKSKEVELAAIKEEAAARQKAVDDEIAAIIGAAAERSTQGPGFDPGFDAAKAAQEAADAAKTFVSTADKPINELAESLVKVNDELRTAQLEFEQAGRASVGGFAGQVEGIFGQQEIDNAERLRKIRGELAQVEKTIADLRAAGVQEGEGALVSALRDEKDLRDAILIAEQTSNELAVTKAATQAALILPSLREEATLLRAQVAEERAVASARIAGLGAREQALVAAQAALATARVEAQVAREKAQAEIQALQARVDATDPGEERDALLTVLNALRERAGLEQEILDIKIAQLEKTREEAELASSGSFAEGARAGLEQLRDELPTIFEAGLELTKQAVTSFANFAATEIVNAIVNAQQEGVDESELFKQAAGRFAQELATQILQTVINNLIQSLLSAALGRAAAEVTTATTAAGIRVTGAQTAAAIEIAAAQTAAAIRAASGGFHDGGLVQGFNAGGFVQGMAAHFSKMAVGLARGGRPPGIHPSDTVPAWLTPGEFVMRRAAVQAIGLPTLTAMNNGNFPVTGSASAEAAGPAVGMQTGGLVSDRIESAQNSQQAREERGTVLPILVAKDREMDQLTAGGRNAFLAFMRENAGNINTLLDRSAGRGR